MHASAFGVGINENNVEKFLMYANEKLANISFDPSYEVDYIFEGNNIDGKIISSIANLKPLWGKGIDEAYVAIEGLILTPKNTTLLSPDKKPTIKITLPGGVSLIKFKSSKEEYSSLTPNPQGYVRVNIVGKCSINSFNGVNTPQILIEEYEIIDTVDYCF